MPAVDYDQLAPFYDALVRDQTDVPFFRSLAARAGGPVLELMSGSGRVSASLAQDRVDLTCVDSSAEMLALLRAKLAAMDRRARVVCDDVTRVDLGATYRLIFIAFHSFEELATDADARSCLINVRRHLDDDGRFVCTLHDVSTRLASVGRDEDARWKFADPRSKKEITLALTTSYDADTGIVSGIQTLSESDTAVPFLSLPLRFRLVRPGAFAGLARDAGLEVESVRADFTDAPYREGHGRTAVWTLRRRSTA